MEIFKTKGNQIEIQVRFGTETVWLSQRQMAEFFEKDSDTWFTFKEYF